MTTRCSLFELERQNKELKKQIEDKDRELERLTTTMDNSGDRVISILQQEILALKEKTTDVRHQYMFVTFIKDLYGSAWTVKQNY